MAYQCLITNQTDVTNEVFGNFSKIYIPVSYDKYKATEAALERYVIPVICLFGLMGNLLNLVVLTRQRIRSSFERLAKSSHVGLLALALSDMLFCISVLPHAFVVDRRRFQSSSIDFRLVYTTYSHAVINTFLLCSTWLTVMLAVSRYLVVKHPLRARIFLGSTAAYSTIGIVFVCSVLFNLPRFWSEIIVSVPCKEGGMSYFAMEGPLQTHQSAELIYMWLYFVLAIIGPLIVLVFCNIYLVHGIRKSQHLRNAQKQDVTTNTRNIVTFTLIIIVVFNMLLVTPAEILNFGRYFMKTKYSFNTLMHYSLAVWVCNTLQAVNFSLNFILYCIINIQFRQVTRNILSRIIPRSSGCRNGKCPSPEPIHELHPLNNRDPKVEVYV